MHLLYLINVDTILCHEMTKTYGRKQSGKRKGCRRSLKFTTVSRTLYMYILIDEPFSIRR